MIRNNIFKSILAASLFIPVAASAQYYSEWNNYQYWNSVTEIIISGPPSIVFPVPGGAVFTDDFGDPRSGRTHEGNDLKAAKMSLVVAES